MRTWREELDQLRDELAQLTELTEQEMCGSLPHFYRHFDTMKNNIEIFICVGSDDTEDIVSILERDWKASHAMLIGVQDYDVRESHPDADPILCLYFAKLLSNIGRYFVQT